MRLKHRHVRSSDNHSRSCSREPVPGGCGIFARRSRLFCREGLQGKENEAVSTSASDGMHRETSEAIPAGHPGCRRGLLRPSPILPDAAGAHQALQDDWPQTPDARALFITHRGETTVLPIKTNALNSCRSHGPTLSVPSQFPAGTSNPALLATDVRCDRSRGIRHLQVRRWERAKILQCGINLP